MFAARRISLVYLKKKKKKKKITKIIERRDRPLVHELYFKTDSLLIYQKIYLMFRANANISLIRYKTFHFPKS